MRIKFQVLLQEANVQFIGAHPMTEATGNDQQTNSSQSLRNQLEMAFLT